MDAVTKLLDELEDILDQGKGKVFSNKVSVDKDEIYDIISEVRLRLPNDIKQSKYIVQERNKILVDAQKEADEIMKAAEEKMARLIDENEITKAAYAQSSEIIEGTKKSAKEMRIGAAEYADEVLSIAEDRLREMQENLRKESISTDEFFGNTLEELYENRRELRGIDR